MNLNAQKIIGFGIAIAGLVAAGKSVTSQAKSIERNGLTLASGLGLIILGGVLIMRFDAAADSTKALLS